MLGIYNDDRLRSNVSRSGFAHPVNGLILDLGPLGDNHIHQVCKRVTRSRGYVMSQERVKELAVTRSNNSMVDTKIGSRTNQVSNTRE